ncbi:MAG: ABC transporter ATP-binding protein [Gammaproteobacteria bacterium]|nr:ABC transporter ATP-binding protein [Gammaproteobacteria bacterium]
MPVLKVENLGKSYPVYRYDWQRAARWFGVSFKPLRHQWVLRHLNFEVKRGEAIGVVGQNGAGKSTLLKLLTGALKPSEGCVTKVGRVSAILELGMGFNYELTGRQNAYFATQLMGLSRREAKRLLPEIAAFCEIGDYFDQPMRTYSSGMQIRVAFAVATAYRPDLLIIDEALSVGDAYFQHKSFSRIREFHEQGTTLFFVSHDKESVQALCDRAIFLQDGGIMLDGTPEEVFDYYNAAIAERENQTVRLSQLANGKTQTVSGTGQARVQEINLLNSLGEAVECIAVGEAVTLRVKVKVFEPIETLVLGYGIKDNLGQMMYGTNTWYTGQMMKQLEAGQVYTFSVSFSANLGVGSYSIVTALAASYTHLSINYEWIDMALLFSVMNKNKITFQGNCWIDSQVDIVREL